VPPAAREEIEAVLSAFRQWLLESEQWRLVLPAPPESAEADEGPVDLHALLGELTALKQEVRLVARGGKTAREDLDRAVETFHGAIDEIRVQSEKAMDPLVRDRDRLRDSMADQVEAQRREWTELILDIREALARGEEMTDRASAQMGWRRWFVPRELFGGMRDGYGLALRRIDAALEARGVHPMDCLGQRVDPQRMRVVDVVKNDQLPEGQVTEIVRNGYTCGDKVIRYAEVRVVARK
jgi:molecular chaperone GrpE